MLFCHIPSLSGNIVAQLCFISGLINNLSSLSRNSNQIQLCSSTLASSQTERYSPLLGLRSRPSLDGGKMRASVRMTRYLESWGAAKPFANLHQRDSLTTDNGKINTTVSTAQCSVFQTLARDTETRTSVGDDWSDLLFQDVPMGQYHFQRRER